MKLETAADARRFNRRLVNAAIRANGQAEPSSPHQLHVAIIGAGATGVELSAELHRTTRELIGTASTASMPTRTCACTRSRLRAACCRPCRSDSRRQRTGCSTNLA